MPAEWEPQSAVQLTWPHVGTDWAGELEAAETCFVQIAQEVSKRQRLLVVAHHQEEVLEKLSGCLSDNILVIELPANDTWARDHAAITVLEEGKPVLLDYMFNGWGLKFPADLDNQLNRKLYSKGVFGDAKMELPGLVLEGGSVESDGKGTLLTTENCLLSFNRNPHLGKAEIEERLAKQLGVHRFLWLENGHLEGDDTDAHIDTLARFCDENTIAYVSCEDCTDPHYEELKKMEEELQSFRKADGTAYKLVALPFVPAQFHPEDGHRLPGTYANFLIINGAVLVPTYNCPAEDQLAIEIVQGCFPDREIVGIDCSVLIRQHGSLHCVTMQFPKEVKI